MGSAVCITAILRWLTTERLFGTLSGRTNRPNTNSYVAGLPNMKTLLTIITIFVLVAACNQDEIIKEVPSPTPVYIEVTRVVTATIPSHAPTSTPQPTATPKPTHTQRPTNTPRSTSTPQPTATHTPIPPTPTPTMTSEELRCRDTLYPGCPGYTETVYFCPHARHCKCKILERDLTYRIADCYHHKYERPPTRTPQPPPTLAYSTGTITKHYSSQSFNVHDIQVQFDTHTFHSNGTTYSQDVCYRVKYRDRQGKSQTVTLKFSLFNYNQRDEYIQLYELSSPGTFDDADAQGMEQALTNLKNKKEERRYTCN